MSIFFLARLFLLRIKIKGLQGSQRVQSLALAFSLAPLLKKGSSLFVTQLLIQGQGQGVKTLQDFFGLLFKNNAR